MQARSQLVSRCSHLPLLVLVYLIVSPAAVMCAMPPSPPQLPACWGDAPSASHWCGATHPGQQDYDAASGAAIATEFGGHWELDARHGWRFCQMSLDECKDACIRMGGCAELDVARNGCCFPARSTCDGSKRTNDDKYVLDACAISSPPLPPASTGDTQTLLPNLVTTS